MRTITIQPWVNCFGAPDDARLRVGGAVVGTVHTGIGQDFWITTQRKWVAEVLGKWLGGSVKRHKYKWGHVEWRVTVPPPLVTVPVPLNGWGDDPFDLERLRA